MALTHNSKTADSEPSWGDVDKTELPRSAHADHGEQANKSTWKYPHHFVVNGGNLNEDGVFTSGDMYLHKGGLNAAWAAAMGARSGQKASQEVISHLQVHRKALGIDVSQAYYQSSTPFNAFDFDSRVIPMELCRTGYGTVHVDDDCAEIFWDELALIQLQEYFEKNETSRKVYVGHESEEKMRWDYKIHRDLDDWVGTLQDSFRIVDTKDERGIPYRTLVGEVLIHDDMEMSSALLNRIKEAPNQIFGSLDCNVSIETVKDSFGRIVNKVVFVNYVNSFDIVPTADFGKLHVAQSSKKAYQSCIQTLNRKLKEVSDMDFKKWKEDHKEEAEKIEAQIAQSAVKSFMEGEDYKTLASLPEKIKALESELEKTNKSLLASAGQKGTSNNEEEKLKVLERENESLKEANLTMSKRLTSIETSLEGAKAESILQSAISKAGLPDATTKKFLQYKPDFRKFLDDNGKLKEEDFTAAVNKEVEDWSSITGEVLQSVGHESTKRIQASEGSTGNVYDDDFII